MVVVIVLVIVVVPMLFGLMPCSARRSGSFVGGIPRHVFLRRVRETMMHAQEGRKDGPGMSIDWKME